MNVIVMASSQILRVLIPSEISCGLDLKQEENRADQGIVFVSQLHLIIATTARILIRETQTHKTSDFSTLKGFFEK